MSDTPRTDAEERWAQWNGEDFQCVDSSFARELERELTEAKRKVHEFEITEQVSTNLALQRENEALKAEITRLRATST